MALNAIVGKVETPGSTGSQGYTGLGITPDVLLFVGNENTAAGNQADAQLSIGFVDPTPTQVSAGYNSDDGSASSDVIRAVLTNRVLGLYGGGTTTASNNANATSLDADGFTLNWNTVISGADLSYMGLSGADVLGATVGNFAASTGGGNQAVTGVGFTPNVVMFITNLQTVSGTANNNSCFSVGAMDASGNQWAAGIGMQNAQATMNNRRAFYNNRCILVPAAGSNAIAHDADFISMDADGFTVNWQTTPGAAYIIGYVALLVTNGKVGTFTQKTSTGSQGTTGVGFQPSALILGSAGHDTANAVVDTARLSIGMTDGTNQFAYWTGDGDNQANAVADSRYQTTKVITMADETGGPSVLAEAGITSLDSDGFTLNWTTADATARNIGYIALGGGSGTTTSTSMSTSTSSTSTSTTVSVTTSTSSTSKSTSTSSTSRSTSTSMSTSTTTTLPLTASIQDNFNDNSFDTDKFTKFGTGANIVETNQRLEITVPTTVIEYLGIITNQRSTLIGSTAHAQLIDAGNQAFTEFEVYPVIVQLDANNHLDWIVYNGSIYAFKRVGGSTTQLFNTTYSATTHQWFRIRESGGTAFWDTSLDGISWTNRYSESSPFSLANVEQWIEIGTYGSEPSDTTAIFDNFNVTPAATTTSTSMSTSTSSTSTSLSTSTSSTSQSTSTSSTSTSTSLSTSTSSTSTSKSTSTSSTSTSISTSSTSTSQSTSTSLSTSTTQSMTTSTSSTSSSTSTSSTSSSTSISTSSTSTSKSTSTSSTSTSRSTSTSSTSTSRSTSTSSTSQSTSTSKSTSTSSTSNSTSTTTTTIGTWGSQVMAWIYPGSPACNADEEYSDGRTIHFLKPEYYTMNSSGVVVQLTTGSSGCNAYSSANALDVKNHSTYQFVTVSSDYANAVAMLGDSGLEQDVIDELVAFVVAENFTGVELDWEEYSSYSPTEYAQYLAFTEDLATQLHAVGKKLMLDGPPIGNATEQGYYEWTYSDFETHSVDYVVVMAYDYQFDYGAGEPMAPDAWVTDIVNWVQSEITSDSRIVIGMVSSAYYGATGGFSPTNQTYDQISAIANFGTSTRDSDSEMEFVNGGNTGVWQDTTAINQQRTLIEAMGVQYVSVWHLGGHNPWFTGSEGTFTTTSTSSSTSTSTSSTSSSTSTSSTSTSTSRSTSTSSTSTSKSTSTSSTSTSKSTSTSSTSTSVSTSSTSTSMSTSTSLSTSSTSTSTTQSMTTSTSSTSTSISTSSTSTSQSTSTSSTSTSKSTSTSSTSTSRSTSTSSTSSSTSTSLSTSSTSTSKSTSTSSTSTSRSTSTSSTSTSMSTSTTQSFTTSTSSTSSSTSSTSSSTSSTTTLVHDDVIPRLKQIDRHMSDTVLVDDLGSETLVDDPVALVDDPNAWVGQPQTQKMGDAKIVIRDPRVK